MDDGNSASSKHGAAASPTTNSVEGSKWGPNTSAKVGSEAGQELPPEPEPKLSPAWKWFLKVTLLLLLLVVLLRFFKGLDTEVLFGRVAGGDRRWWGAAVVLLGLRLLAWDSRWRRALKEVGVQALRSRTLPALLGAIFLNSVTPTGRVAGGVFRTRHAVREAEGGAAPIFGSVLYDQVLHQVVALAAAVLSVLVLGVATGQQLWVAAALGTVALVLALAWGIPAWSRLRVRQHGKAVADGSIRRGGWSGLVRWTASRIERQGGRSLALVTEGRHSFREFRRLVRHRQLAWFGIVLSLWMILLLGLAEWCCFRSLGSNPGLIACILAVSVGTAVGGLVGTPGGVGGVEAGMVMVLTSLGVEATDALAATVLFRALHYAVVLTLGVPAFFWCESTRRM
ncbi:MAG: flippase-like domain-containing protein [Thermoanaerobaculia bacterium]|nr:flippase-like domain-containing protein [Thermoanaerobaculia bacterium]